MTVTYHVVCLLESSSLAPAEVGCIDPHAVEDDTEFSSQSHFGAFGTATFGNPNSPRLEFGPLRHSGEDDVGGFEQGEPDGGIAGLADRAVTITFARLVFPRREAKAGSDGLGRFEPLWLIDGRAEAQRHDSSHTRRRHQPPAYVIGSRHIADPLVENGELIPDGLACDEQWLDD